MKKIILYGLNVVLLLICNNAIIAQDRIDTIYYDEESKGVYNKQFADFYRIAIYPTDTISHKKLFRDYYITGELLSKGGFVSIDNLDDSKSIFDGKRTVYFKNGKIKEAMSYQNGELNGEYITYFENGLIERKANFVNGKLSGLLTVFLENGNFLQLEYDNDETIYDYYIMGDQNGRLIKIRYANNKPMWESPDLSEQKTEYKDGRTWEYYVKNGLTITMSDSEVKLYGKWHRCDIMISNNSMVPIEFDPEINITAYSFNRKERRTDLDVWSYEDYIRVVRNEQILEAVVLGISEGLSTVNAGRTTSTTIANSYYDGNSNSYGNASIYGRNGYTYGSYMGNSSYRGNSYTISTTTTYDATAAYQAQVLSQNRMAEFSSNQLNIRNIIQQGYLKKNTIYPGETIVGYVHIERIPFVMVYVIININGAKYRYNWEH